MQLLITRIFEFVWYDVLFALDLAQAKNETEIQPHPDRLGNGREARAKIKLKCFSLTYDKLMNLHKDRKPFLFHSITSIFVAENYFRDQTRCLKTSRRRWTKTRCKGIS